MNKLWLFSISLILIYSCKQFSDTEDSRKCRELNSLKKITRCTTYYSNGKVKRIGNYLRDLPDSIHLFYDEHGFLTEVRDYIVFKGEAESYLNQIIYLTHDGDTITNKSHYYTIRFLKGKNYEVGDTIDIIIQLKAPLFKSNEAFAFVETNEDSLWRKYSNDYSFHYRLIANQSGIQNFKGYIEVFEITKEFKDSVEGWSNYMHFYEPYFVK